MAGSTTISGGLRICDRGFLAGYPTELMEVVSKEECCKLHKKVQCGIAGGLGCEGWRSGTHHAIAGLYMDGDYAQRCFAEEAVLLKDREFAKFVLGAPRVSAYLQINSSWGTAKFLTSDVPDITSFGAGFCSLQGVRARGRMRCARVLGPAPLIADALRVFNVVGDYEIGRLEWEQVKGGLFHIRPRGRLEFSDVAGAGQKFFSDGMKILKDVGPYACVGVDACDVDQSFFSALVRKSIGRYAFADRVESCVEWRAFEPVSVSPSREFTPIGKKGKAACSLCKKIVDPLTHGACVARELMDCGICGMKVVKEGHAERCVVPVVSDPALELLGDAMHALDVKILAVMCAPKKEFTIFAAGYMNAASQKAYLQGLGVELGGALNVHSWGSEFERRYHGEFRLDYIQWLIKREEVGLMPSTVDSFIGGYSVDDVAVHQYVSN